MRANWIAVVLYFTTSWRCLLVSQAAARFSAEREYVAWRGFAALYLVLGINRLLDFESVLTRLGRSFVFHLGWMDHKFTIQASAIAIVLVVCILTGLALAFLMRCAHWASWLGMFGAIFIVGFVAVRALSLHDIDQFIDSRFLVLRWNSILEIGGIVSVLIASFWKSTPRSLLSLPIAIGTILCMADAGGKPMLAWS